jgi:MarR family 2-MHQ and catechol resistance regulon transcriptional repressor
LKTTRKYGKKADLALSMWVKLVRATSTFGKLTEEQIRSFGLTEPQFGVLECLGHLGPLTLGELSKKQLVSGGNITCVVDNLEKEGLAERIPSTEDRRAIVAQLTVKGKKMFDEIFVKHAEFVARTASVLSEEEQETLSQLLKKLGLSLKGREQSESRKTNTF